MPATRRLAAPAVVLATALVVAACGGSATASPASPSAAPATEAPATEAPTPVPTPTAAPTEAPTAAPTEAASAAASPDRSATGGFAFAPGDVLDYYVSQGFVCDDPYPSDQAAGYTVVRCFKEGTAADPILMIAMVVNDEGVTGDAFAASLRPAGEEAPDPQASLEHLTGFLSAMVGEEHIPEAASWLSTALGGEAQTAIAGLTVGTYTSDDETGVGYYVEVASDAFMNAPAP